MRPISLSFIHVIILKMHVFFTACHIHLICGPSFVAYTFPLFLCAKLLMGLWYYLYYHSCPNPSQAYIRGVTWLCSSCTLIPVLYHHVFYVFFYLILTILLYSNHSAGCCCDTQYCSTLTSLSKPPFPDCTPLRHMWSLCCIHFIHMSKRSSTFTCHMFIVPLVGQCVIVPVHF